jgi:hypothetical protein
VEDHEESSLHAASKYYVRMRTALIITTYLEFQWKFQSGESEREEHSKSRAATNFTKCPFSFYYSFVPR